MDSKTKIEGMDMTNRKSYKGERFVEDGSYYLSFNNFVKFYITNYWPIAKRNLFQYFLDRGFVNGRNTLILDWGINFVEHYIVGSYLGNKARTIVRNIRSGDNLVRLELHLPGMEFKQVYSLFLTVSVVFGSSFIFVDVLGNVGTLGTRYVPLIIMFALMEMMFVVSQIESYFLHKKLDLHRLNSRRNVLISFLQNMIITKIFSFVKISNVNENTSYFVLTFFLTIVECLKGYGLIHTIIPEKFRNLVRIFREGVFLFRQEKNRKIAFEFLVIPNLNIAVTNLLGKVISNMRVQKVVNKGLVYQLDYLNNSFYFLMNVWETFSVEARKDYVKAIARVAKERSLRDGKFLLKYTYIHYYIEIIKVIPYVLFFLKPAWLFLIVNKINSITSTSYNANSISRIVFDKEMELHVLLRSGILMIMSSISMFPIEEITSTGDFYYSKYETLFSAFIDGSPYVLFNMYSVFTCNSISYVLDFGVHGFLFLALKNQGIKKNIGRECSGKTSKKNFLIPKGYSELFKLTFIPTVISYVIIIGYYVAYRHIL